jgi:hypothetical protein
LVSVDTLGLWRAAAQRQVRPPQRRHAAERKDEATMTAEQRRALARRMVAAILIGLAVAAAWVWSGKWDALLISFIACVVIVRISYRRFVRRMAEKINYRMESWRGRTRQPWRLTSGAR